MYSQNGHHGYGPPPAKRSKGNPIITRYPPPPGYQQGVPYTPPVAWQNRSYSHPHPGYQQPQHSQPPYQPHFVGLPTPQHTPTNGYSSDSHFTQQPPWSPAINTPQSAPPPSSWHPPPSNFARNGRRHNSAPFVAARQPVLDGNGDLLPPEDLVTSTVSDLETDFDGECYFARYPDEINPELSLGTISWKPPLPARHALPGTFKEAELEALAPRIDEPMGEVNVSDYFSNHRRDEAFLSVRQTEHWAEMQHDLIFRDFPRTCMNLVSLGELLAKWRDRYDASWTDPPPTPELSRPVSRASSSASRVRYDEGGILDDLEAALQTNNKASVQPEQRRPHSRASSVSSHHSRASSIHSHHRRQSSNVSQHKALPPIRDPGQEDILAALGVTGSPKLVYETPGPAFGPRPSSSAGREQDSHSRTSSFSSAHGANDRMGRLQHIPELVINEELEPDDMATPRPKKPHAGDTSRKRSYADAGPGAYEEVDEEETPRGKHARML